MFNFKEALTPDPTLHRNISFIKSALRIFAGLFLTVGNYPIAGLLVIVAEVLGVVEELV